MKAALQPLVYMLKVIPEDSGTTPESSDITLESSDIAPESSSTIVLDFIRLTLSD